MYDLFGYMLPGSVLLILISYEKIIEFAEEIIQYENFTGIFVFVFIICSYVCGIVISQIARFILDIIYCKFIKKIQQFKTSKIDTKIVKEALINSKLVNHKIQEDDIVDKYMTVMYADIQTDDNFKRIHNYESSEVMYKNLSISFLIGSLVTDSIIIIPFGKFSISLPCVCAFMALIMGVRAIRFLEKRRRYTVIWFLKKHMGIKK